MKKTPLELLLLSHMADFSQTTSLPQTGRASFAFVLLGSEKVWLGTSIDAQALLDKVLARKRGANNNAQFPAAFVRHVRGREEIRFFACRRYSPERHAELKAALIEGGYLIRKNA